MSRKEIVFRFLQVIEGMIVTGQEKSGKNDKAKEKWGNFTLNQGKIMSSKELSHWMWNSRKNEIVYLFLALFMMKGSDTFFFFFFQNEKRKLYVRV